MIITRLTGGLGNQMFQYAFGRALAERHKTELKLDITSYSDPRYNDPPRTYDLGIFNIREQFASDAEIVNLAKRTRIDLIDRVLNRLIGVKEGHVREPHFQFSRSAAASTDNVYLSGYWQTEKYFSDIETILRREFTFREEPSEQAEKLLNRIAATESVGVHIRRGDYLINPINGLYGMEYYSEAEKTILQKTAAPTYFIFSDDLDWCEANLRFNGETMFVRDDFGGQKFRDDFRLMAACKHLIIANSSYSWWAAWLNPNPDKIVIAPKVWFKGLNANTNDLIPEKWIRI